MDCGSAKKYKKRFQRHWYDVDDSLKVWLQEVTSDESKCFCKACNKTFHCGLSEIRRHSSRQVHVKNVEQMLHNNVVNSSNQSEEELVSKTLETETLDQAQGPPLFLSEKIKIAELKYATFVAEHNIPVSVASSFLTLMKDIGHDSQILQGMKIGRTKCRQIINDVLRVRPKKRTNCRKVRHNTQKQI